MGEDEFPDSFETFVGEHTVAAPNKSQKNAPILKRHAVLIVMTGSTTGQIINLEVKDTWVLGRASQNDVVFYDVDVSRRHCQINRKGPDQWFLQDLNSSNGTWVNDQKVTQQILKSDDKVQLGPNVIVKYVLQDGVETTFQKELYESATKDSLTSLYTKRYFLERLEAEFNHHRRAKRPLSLILTDIDFFKKVNDTYGHLAGDFVLKEIGEIYLSAIRQGDLAGRYGGEEFIFFLRETDMAGAKIFAERIRKMVESYSFVFEGTKIPVTISLGIAHNGSAVTNSTQLIQTADEFLYKAKKSGRNRSICATDAIK